MGTFGYPITEAQEWDMVVVHSILLSIWLVIFVWRKIDSQYWLKRWRASIISICDAIISADQSLIKLWDKVNEVEPK